MLRRKPSRVAIIAMVFAIFLYAQQHLLDRDGIPIRALGVSDVRAHAESGPTYPGAWWMSGQVNGEGRGAVAWICIGLQLPAQASATYQTPVREAKVAAWYEHWLRGHRWGLVSDRGPAEAGGTGFQSCIVLRDHAPHDGSSTFDRRIAFSRGGREHYSVVRGCALGWHTDPHQLYVRSLLHSDAVCLTVEMVWGWVPR